MKLFGVYLGGTAKGCHIEVHDFVFAIGDSIEDTYSFLRRIWFGNQKGLHIDSWVDLSELDGYKVTVCESSQPQESEYKVFFVNLGGYLKECFGERHHDIFVVAKSKAEAKSAAKKQIEQKFDLPHIDFTYEVDDCIEAAGFDNMSIEVTEDDGNGKNRPLEYHSGYFKI